MSVRFKQSCPTCGRRIDVRASLLGCTVACQHCGAEFIASANQDLISDHDSGEELMERVEAALKRADALADSGESVPVASAVQSQR